MELIRISDKKIKIMLTPTDMCHFELNADSFGEDNAKTHRAFRRLLNEIRLKTGFEADNGHLSVQYFPSREGGCEMFISNLPGEEAESELHETGLSAASSLPVEGMQLRPFRKHGGSFKKDCAYRFGKLPHLLQVCKRLSGLGIIGESTAYKDEKNAYFLFFSVLSISPFSTPEELDFIVEYGSIENASLLRLYIREHATILCPTRAIEKLSELV
ncbi:MAG: adaptor protein MecA [Clostridia bacterium]|nr:adaptor protein MecA [Clostridia bacterium]